MIELLGYDFMQRAILAGVAVASVSALIGTFLVLRRISMIGEGLAHTALGGVALGLFFGVYPLAVAVPFTVAGALAMYFLGSRGRLYGDTALAILFAGGLSLGVILLSLSDGFNTDLFSYLFGSILAVNPRDLYIMLALGGVVSAVVLVLYRPLLYITFDEESARASGIPVEALNILLTALTVVVAVQLVGILMVSALLVVPVATSLQVVRSFRQTLGLAVVTGIVCVLGGLMAAYYLDLAAGGSIVMGSVILFLLVTAGRYAVTKIR